MRKQVKYLKIKSNNDKYYFKGISLVDIQMFFEKIKFDKEKIRIYQDIFQESEDNQSALNKNRYYHNIKRRIKKFDTGNDCFVAVNYYDNAFFENSCDRIFYEKEEYIINDSIIFIAYIHDIDWLSVIIFNDLNLKNMFFEFIINNSKMIEEKSIDNFYD